MDQLLQRGYELINGSRIIKPIASGKGWQIFSTSYESLALAVKVELYHYWESIKILSGSAFCFDKAQQVYIFCGTPGHLISSLSEGPYPEKGQQIEAFSMAFHNFLDKNLPEQLTDAIYIEEISLILPGNISSTPINSGYVYGKWLTGGVNVSIEAIDRISSLMTWLPRSAIEKYAVTAGFNNLKENVNSNQGGNETEKDKVGALDLDRKFELVGRPELEQFFNDNIIDIVTHREQYKNMGIDFPGATILYGPPGCGKTYAVEKLTEFLGWDRFDIDSSTIASPYIHDTSKKISEVFQTAMESAPSIIVIDEMEAFLSDRSSDGGSNHHVEEVAEFLRRIPEAISHEVLIIAMTNLIDSIDKAILRRGRFDYIIEVKMASSEEIEALLRHRFKELPIGEDVDVKNIADSLAEHPMSDVTYVIREAGKNAVKRKLDFMTNECFVDAINMLPKKKEKNKIGFLS